MLTAVLVGFDLFEMIKWRHLLFSEYGAFPLALNRNLS